MNGANRELQRVTKEQLEDIAQRRGLVHLDPDISGGGAGQLVIWKCHEADSTRMRGGKYKLQSTGTTRARKGTRYKSHRSKIKGAQTVLPASALQMLSRTHLPITKAAGRKAM